MQVQDYTYTVYVFFNASVLHAGLFWDDAQIDFQHVTSSVRACAASQWLWHATCTASRHS